MTSLIVGTYKYLKRIIEILKQITAGSPENLRTSTFLFPKQANLGVFVSSLLQGQSLFIPDTIW
jgi:hypothetical protein